jgi:hypothetical protein
MKRVHRSAWCRWLVIGANAIWMGVVVGSAAGAEDADLRAAKEALTYLHEVAMHPRCMNCHGRVHNGWLVPLVGDRMEPHPMNITSLHNPGEQPRSVALACSSCHGLKNSPQLAGPPGAPKSPLGLGWQMPTHETMRLWPDRGRGELCNQWQRAIKELIEREVEPGKRRKAFDERVIEHFDGDFLIRWAFDPGPGRTRAPGSHGQLVSMATTWARWLIVDGHSCQQLDDR